MTDEISSAAQTPQSDSISESSKLEPSSAKPDLPAPDWSSDWRLKITGGDEKRAKGYEKYASPKELSDAYLSLQQQLSSGEYKRTLPDKATPEQIAEWRKANGIPDSPEKYDFNLPNGLVLGENDLPVAKDFAAQMHSINADQKTVQKAIEWWANSAKKAAETRMAEDAEYKKQSEDVLRAEWGGEYRMNEAAISNLIEGMPKELGAIIMEARGPDGKLIWDNPSFRSHMLKQAYLENPVRMVIPSGGGDSIDNITQQLADIAKVSREEPSRYNKDIAMQNRRQKLLEAQAVLKKRQS